MAPPSGRSASSSRRATTTPGRATTSSRCSPIRRGASIWAMSATTRWATSSRATSAPRVSRCCTRWAGTLSACRRRTPPSRRRSTRASGPMPTSRRCASSSVHGPVARLEPRARHLRPSYYRHQQKMFLDFLKAGLVDRKTAKVNWDPVDETVLANEQVIDGKGWRSGAPVEIRELTQWFFKITTFGQELNDALEGLTRWPDKVRLMQKNWIGRSEGLLVRFALESKAGRGRRDRGLHDPARHAVRREVSRHRPRSSHCQDGRREEPCAAGLHRRVQAHRHGPGNIDKAEKLGFDTGLRVTPIPSIRPGRCRSMSRTSS